MKRMDDQDQGNGLRDALIVTSDVVTNSTAVSDSINGYLVRTTEEWIDALVRLIVDRVKRIRIGE
jgi:hypothetical protein